MLSVSELIIVVAQRPDGLDGWLHRVFQRTIGTFWLE